MDNTAQYDKRLPALDGVRGLAILLVLAYHYTQGGVAPWLQQHARHSHSLEFGQAGVDLFFVLSGFLVTRLLTAHRGARNEGTGFFVRRVARLLPLYTVLLAGFYIALALGGAETESPRWQWLLGSPLPAWSYLSLTQNFAAMERAAWGANWLAITWTLAVEVQAYLVLYTLVRLCPRPRLALSLSALAMLSVGLRFLFANWWLSVVCIPFRFESFALGGLIALAAGTPAAIVALRDWHRWMPPTGALLAVGWIGLAYRGSAIGPLYFTWVALSGAWLVLLAVVWPGHWLGVALRWPPLRYVGQISYGIYLLHQMTLGAVFALARGGPPQLAVTGDWLYIGVALAGVRACRTFLPSV